MASEAQIAANRRNAQRSTGPRSAEGKARVARNGLKHGLCAIETLLPGEDEAAFAALLADLAARFPPADEAELASIFRIADLIWRLARCAPFEAALLATDGDWGELERLCAHESRLSRRFGEALDDIRSRHAARSRPPGSALLPGPRPDPLPQGRERESSGEPSPASTPLPFLRVAERPSPKAAKARGRKGPVAQRREGEGQGTARSGSPSLSLRPRREREQFQPLPSELALDSRFRLAARAPP